VATLAVDPHLDAVDFWERTELPDGGSARIPGPPFRSSADWWRLDRAPRLDEHGAAIRASSPASDDDLAAATPHG
jgi:crotonobetainyl-CoA:carnitine CoA-transferase CaiB-like acyl-CoA transferase